MKVTIFKNKFTEECEIKDMKLEDILNFIKKHNQYALLYNEEKDEYIIDFW